MRGEDMYIIQPTSNPANDNLMELLIITDALRRSSAARITAVIPYFGYARQDRRAKARTPITAKLVANLITEAGIDRVLTLDLHAAQIQGFFDIPVDNLYASPVFALDIEHHFKGQMDDLMVVSPDVGGVARARELAKRINAPLAIVDKRREKAGEVAEMTVIGNVAGKNCIIVDDICDTAGTLCKAAEVLMENGATEVHSYITHGVLSGPAVERMQNSVMKSLVITDSIEPTDAVQGRHEHPHRADRADVRAGDPEHLERHLGVVAVRNRYAGADLRRHVSARLMPDRSVRRAHHPPNTDPSRLRPSPGRSPSSRRGSARPGYRPRCGTPDESRLR